MIHTSLLGQRRRRPKKKGHRVGDLDCAKLYPGQSAQRTPYHFCIAALAQKMFYQAVKI